MSVHDEDYSRNVCTAFVLLSMGRYLSWSTNSSRVNYPPNGQYLDTGISY